MEHLEYISGCGVLLEKERNVKRTIQQLREELNHQRDALGELSNERRQLYWLYQQSCESTRVQKPLAKAETKLIASLQKRFALAGSTLPRIRDELDARLVGAHKLQQQTPMAATGKAIKDWDAAMVQIEALCPREPAPSSIVPPPEAIIPLPETEDTSPSEVAPNHNDLPPSTQELSQDVHQ